MSMLNKLGIGYTVESMVKNRSWVHYDYVEIPRGVYKVPSPIVTAAIGVSSSPYLDDILSDTGFKPGEVHEIAAHSAFGFSRPPKSSFHLKRLESRLNSVFEDVNYDPHSLVVIDKTDEFLKWEARMYVDHIKKHIQVIDWKVEPRRDIGLGVQGWQEIMNTEDAHHKTYGWFK
jgi:hypothetical protein